MSSEERWATTAEVADHLRKSVFTVRNRAKAGLLPGVKQGRDWMFKISEVDAFLRPPVVDPLASTPHSRTRKR